MWRFISEHMPSGLTWFYMALCAIVPAAAYRINKRLHDLTDQPWKRQRNSGE